MWSAGAGLALVFVGPLNAVPSRARRRALNAGPRRGLVYVANFLTLSFGAVTGFLDSGPRVVFGTLLTAAIKASASLLKRAAP